MLFSEQVRITKKYVIEIPYEIYEKLKRVKVELKKEGINPVSIDEIAEIALKAFLELPSFNKAEVIKELRGLYGES